jgi:hypothetical protein
MGVVKTRNAGIWRNMTEYGGISRHFPGIYRNITICSDGSNATVYKHGRLTTLTTYFITKVMDLSHFDVIYERERVFHRDIQTRENNVRVVYMASQMNRDVTAECFRLLI